MQNIVINKPWYIDPNEVSICEFCDKSKYTFSKILKEASREWLWRCRSWSKWKQYCLTDFNWQKRWSSSRLRKHELFFRNQKSELFLTSSSSLFFHRPAATWINHSIFLFHILKYATAGLNRYKKLVKYSRDLRPGSKVC